MAWVAFRSIKAAMIAKESLLSRKLSLSVNYSNLYRSPGKMSPSPMPVDRPLHTAESSPPPDTSVLHISHIPTTETPDQLASLFGQTIDGGAASIITTHLTEGVRQRARPIGDEHQYYSALVSFEETKDAALVESIHNSSPLSIGGVPLEIKRVSMEKPNSPSRGIMISDTALNIAVSLELWEKLGVYGKIEQIIQGKQVFYHP